MKVYRITHPVTEAPPLLLPGLFAELPTPPAKWFDQGLERDTRTISPHVGETYRDAQCTLETIVGHPLPFVVANYYGQTHELRLHDDKPDLWGAVAIVSLGPACDFSLVPQSIGARVPGTRASKPGVHLELEHGDVVYLTEPANRYWHHGGLMPAGRYSLVLREHAPATHEG